MGASLCGEEWRGEESEEVSTEGLLNINQAAVRDLMTLPGIGRSRAESIVTYRDKNGPFRTARDLANVPGIGEVLASKVAADVEGLQDDSDSEDEDHASGAAPGGCCGCNLWCPTGPCGLCRKKNLEEVLFFPDDKKGTGLQRILDLLATAQRSLDVAVFSISHKDLAAALLAARKRGVKVRILTDDMQAKQENSCVSELKREIPLRFDRSEKLHMHHKFVVIDGTTLLSGSLNWTHAAVERGNENLVISKRLSLCEDFADEFNRLWRFFDNVNPRGVADASAAFFRSKAAALFFPEATKQCNARLIEIELESARESIDVAVFTLTLDSLVNILIKKHKDGLRVRVITDNRQAGVPGADAQRLREAGVEVRVDRSWYAMHHKFAVIDQRRLINGSFNWTAQATKGNQEDCVIWRDHPRLAESFTQEFDRMWEKFDPA